MTGIMFCHQTGGLISWRAYNRAQFTLETSQIILLQGGARYVFIVTKFGAGATTTRRGQHTIKVNHFSLGNISYIREFKRICCILIQIRIFWQGYVLHAKRHRAQIVSLGYLCRSRRVCKKLSETHSCVILFLMYAARIGARPISVGEMVASVTGSAVKVAPSGISHKLFHCVNTCREIISCTCTVTITEITPNCVKRHYKYSDNIL